MEKKSPLLSIITVNYNNAEGLRRTMQSVLDLNFKDYEYLIIDGGSSDESKSVIQYYLENTELKYKINYWCSEKDSGIYNAMNKGIMHASGVLLNFMNSGDTFLSDGLDTFQSTLKTNPNCVLYGAINKVRNNEFLGTSGVSQCDINNGIIWHQASFIPKQFFTDYGKYDEQYRIRADYEHFFRLARKNVKFVFLNRIICTYDFSGVSSTNKKLCKKEGKIIKNKYCKTKKTKLLWNFIKLFIPYGILVMLWNIKDSK